MANKQIILPYKRAYVELESLQPIEKEKTSFINISSNIIFLHLIAFLLGRAGILEGLTPFGLGFFTALSQKDRKYGFLGITTFVGILTVRGLSSSLPYGIALVIIYSVFRYLLDLRKTNIFKSAIIGSASYLGIGTLALLFSRFYLYDFIMIGFEALVIFVVVYISSYVIPIAVQSNSRKILSAEETICIAIVAALALSGINQIYIVDLSIRNIIGILITILFAYNGGASIGASVGITLGLITSMSTGSTPVIIGIFGFSGLLAGIFKDLGKVGTAFGFLIGNAILTFYINGYYEIFIQFKEVALASLFFLILPASYISQMEKFSNTRLGILNSSRTHSDRTKKITYQKLKEFAVTFEELSDLFVQISEKHDFFPDDEVSNLIDKVANSVCQNCSMRRSCWEKNFNITYQSILDLLLTVEGKSTIVIDDLPQDIKKRCIRPKDILEEIVHLYELSYLNITWKQRLIESRELVGKQLKGVAQVIDELAVGVKDKVEFDVDLEDEIYVALDKAGLTTTNVMATSLEKGKLEIIIDRKHNYTNEAVEERFANVISNVVGVKLVKKPYSFNRTTEKEGTSFTLVQANKYEALTKSAAAIKDGNKVSGDSYTFVDLKNGQYMTAISDGMGTGEKAHIQSKATIEMLEKMMEAGFHREIAIQTINSMLMLKSSEEMFSSLDMALIDLHEGSADFVKIGSASSYIKRRNGKIEEIRSSTLPIGILRDIQVEGNIQKLEDGDIIITISDGIIDSNQEGNQWIKEYLQKLSSLNPQEIADNILYRALQYTNGKATDDLTVLVTKMWEV